MTLTELKKTFKDRVESASRTWEGFAKSRETSLDQARKSMKEEAAQLRKYEPVVTQVLGRLEPQEAQYKDTEKMLNDATSSMQRAAEKNHPEGHQDRFWDEGESAMKKLNDFNERLQGWEPMQRTR